MNTVPFQSSARPPWYPVLPPNQPMSSTYWETRNVYDQLRDLQDTLKHAEAMQKELEILMVTKDGRRLGEDKDNGSNDGFSKLLEDKKISLELQEALSVKAANSLMSKLRVQLEPFRIVTDEMSPWEEKSAAFRLSNRIQKSKRNKVWRKRKRQRVAEMLTKERERFDEADKEADEWRATEIAKDIAKCKVEKLKEIAKLKAKEERRKLESELEMVLIVEKLKELRSMRIDKLKKQGHFLPEEDDKFLERVRVAVEEEERQTIAAADTEVAKDAIATAAESRNTVQYSGLDSKDISSDKGSNRGSEGQITGTEDSKEIDKEAAKGGLDKQGHVGPYDSVANLPIEFYHYYHGSNTDMGTLVEVRRTWDAYIRPGGSRIPGHWVQPPPPADEVWASYLVRPR
ncbi:U11/U12 small nuclear ribonucleoprotein 59 kDa protein [Quillaja saponaria]|uniref:U11/U12 small nuclear ribonucleoprotein 59 kDa protein n=1 Tax=Quillaja saponaria TaxID=32244 RepID=A0AAD7LQH1_QUISA|nr:U11/U12 small nuclear ribonucleoprotein 59 kDa protein [Quillaja saponaria]